MFCWNQTQEVVCFQTGTEWGQLPICWEEEEEEEPPCGDLKGGSGSLGSGGLSLLPSTRDRQNIYTVKEDNEQDVVLHIYRPVKEVKSIIFMKPLITVAVWKGFTCLMIIYSTMYWFYTGTTQVYMQYMSNCVEPVHGWWRPQCSK